MSAKCPQAPKAELQATLDGGGYVLFLGAGASAEAGVPPWNAALLALSSAVEARSPHYAAAIRSEVERGRFLEAAECFYLADLTSQERADVLQATFSVNGRVSSRLRALARQPFRAVVTTNYDLSMIDAAQSEHVKLVQFGEGDLATARVARDPFILRLHGRIEVPDSIVLARSHYDKLRQNQEYAFFVQTLVSDATLVFFGFSFTDPHFLAVLQMLAGSVGGRMRNKSFALLAGTPPVSTSDLLNRLNIVVVQYSPDNNHAEAWDMMSKSRTSVSAAPEHYSEKRLRQTLAAVLTHLRLQKQSDLRGSVLAAAVLASLEATSADSLDSITRSVLSNLALPQSEAYVIRKVVAELIAAGRMQQDGETIGRVTPSDADAASTNDLRRITTGIMARAKARYGIIPAKAFDYENALREVLLRVLIADGLTLAHSFVRNTSRSVENVEKVVSYSTRGLDNAQSKRIEPLHDAIVSVLVKPEPDEEAALDELASVAFMLCTTLTEPRLPFLAEQIARHTAYLDASVLLPWLSSGHPTNAVYGAIVQNLSTPAVADFYLNEVVKHRELALKEYREAGLDDRRRFEHYARFNGLGNINAFLGGFGGSLSRNDCHSFPQYLEAVAPYRTELDLRSYLEKKGVRVVTPGRITANVDLVEQIVSDRLESYDRGRNSIRVRHDATMIGMLLQTPKASRGFFVTADRTLISTLADSIYREVLMNVLLPHQALSLAQLSGRARGVVKGLARTVFAVSRNDAKQLKEYYIDRVLAEYEPALLRDVPRIVNAIIQEAEDFERSSIIPADTTDKDTIDRVERFRQLDQFESRFHEEMVAARARQGL